MKTTERHLIYIKYKSYIFELPIILNIPQEDYVQTEK